MEQPVYAPPVTVLVDLGGVPVPVIVATRSVPVPSDQDAPE